MSTPSTQTWMDLVDPSFLLPLRAIVQKEIAPAAVAVDRDDVYPTDAIRALAKAGYSTVFMPAPWGGGLNYPHALAVFEEVSYSSAAVGTSLITILQAQTILRLFGSPALQDRYLPAFGQGLISSYALTETNHGSDIRTLDSKARKTDTGWVLDGEKSFITSGSAAEFFIILAESDAGISAFAVPAEAKGVLSYLGENSSTFGLRNGPHINLVLDGVTLPADHLIGEDGKGIRQVVTTLDYSRTVAAGISLGIARAAFDQAFSHARRQGVRNRWRLRRSAQKHYCQIAVAFATSVLVYPFNRRQ